VARARDVVRFVEKPDRETAAEYMARGWLWNTGIFVWRADAILREARSHAHELAAALDLLDANDIPGFFDAAPVLSIDHAVLERSGRLAVVAASFDWDDVGAWDAVARTREADDRGNVAIGCVAVRDCDNVIVWAEDEPVVAFGVSDLIVVRANGVTLVLDRSRSGELKTLLEGLPSSIVERDG
jgi:mannose-1-phosphate guanylyltransferase